MKIATYNIGDEDAGMPNRFQQLICEINGINVNIIKNPYPTEFPVLKDCAIFGTEISDKTCLAASDHYGVIVEMEF
ncbi:MAG: hypothetical protein J1E83_12555 [Lachnospiraceae bacterium]|nr:hypothetical protein [Lachnospiraceae bacterium]